MRGRILVGDHKGVYVLMFEGDVRLTLCTAVDSFLDRMFRDPGCRSVVVDLVRTESIDSTSLGLLAKLSIQAAKRLGARPTLVSTRTDITRILRAMGLDDVFNLIEAPLEHRWQVEELPCQAATEEEMRTRVLEAHRLLMGMNEENRASFQDLVTALEQEITSRPVRCRASL